MKFFLALVVLISSFSSFASEEVCSVSKTISRYSQFGNEGEIINRTNLSEVPMPKAGEALYYVAPDSSEVVVLINYGIGTGERSFEVYFHKNINALKNEAGEIDPHLAAVRPATYVQGYFTPGQNTVWVRTKILGKDTITEITAFCGK
jgi:hypothetical protein